MGAETWRAAVRNGMLASNTTEWIENELAGIDLGDERLNTHIPHPHNEVPFPAQFSRGFPHFSFRAFSCDSPRAVCVRPAAHAFRPCFPERKWGWVANLVRGVRSVSNKPRMTLGDIGSRGLPFGVQALEGPVAPPEVAAGFLHQLPPVRQR